MSFQLYNGTDYAVESGTSMADPMLQELAWYKAEFPDASPADVISNITSSGSLPNAICEGGPRGYFTGDVDTFKEPLLLREFHPS